ncbi:hypothetical protein C6361_07080 [Plantactinospora sp. BC1]|nr:hypothetical protein C6361_07080 [Plantactinospora sp. BC1]
MKCFAARWTTAQGRTARCSSATVSASQMLARWCTTPASSANACSRRSVPALPSSRMATDWPAARSRRTTAMPRKPAPPVTSTGEPATVTGRAVLARPGPMPGRIDGHAFVRTMSSEVAAVIRVLVDGRIDAPDGIGRYTRCTVAALRSAGRIRLDVLAPTGTPRYGSAEADELLDAARRFDADVIHLFDYRIPWPDPGIPLVVTVHDVVRLLDPGLCYSDQAFAARFGAADLAALRRAVAELRVLTPPAPAARTRPASAHEEYYGLMMAHLAATAARIVVPTETVAGQFRASVRADAPLRVSSWGSDHLLAAPAPPDGAVPPLHGFVLYVGLARAHKRIGAVLDAYARTTSRRRGVPLVLVGGDFAPGGTGADQVAEHPVGTDAVLLGAVQDGALQALYRRAGAVVSLSASEGFGFPPLEALAAGAPVVAADIPTYRELLGAAARLVDPDDVEATARAIDESLAAGPPPAAAGVAPRSWAAHGRTLVELYREAVQERAR